MELYELLVLDSVLALFPICIWLFYVTYNKNIEKKENNLILDFVLITSFYLMIRFGKTEMNGMPLLIINVPLIIAYIKKRNISIFILSVSLIFYYYHFFNYNLIPLFLEYISYYALFLLLDNDECCNKRFIFIVMLIKSFLFVIWTFNTHILDLNNLGSLINLIYMISSMIFVTLIVIVLCYQGEEILKYHMTIKELEQEKQIRTSLFRITHEIKNPIAVCKGYLDMFDINNLNHSHKYIPIIKEEIERTLILLQDFLCMTKIKIDCDIVDINMILEDISDNFLPMMKKNKIKSDFDIKEDSIYIYGDYNRLTQTFINIIKNSIEAKDEKKNSYIKIYTELTDETVKIIIEDNGVGISEENLKKITEPFFTTKIHGTGLGVSLSYEIIKSHKGTIDYISKEGVGTTVIIELPLKKQSD